uniref:Ig-like domain-containing protein n=1 Tax=Scleropages formosus TaxID=113540 RepID=A0A8C9VVC8_SCLFO
RLTNTTAGFLPHITLSSASIAPSSLTHLMLFFTSSDVQSADEVTQSPASKEVTEGQSVIIDCSYKTSNFYAMQWYKQPINGGSPKYINRATGSTKYGDYSGKYQPEVVTSEKRGTLRITPTADDSAIYYCAIQATTVTREALHSSKNLQQKSSGIQMLIDPLRN